MKFKVAVFLFSKNKIVVGVIVASIFTLRLWDRRLSCT
jgi:hypothetical protein